MLDLPSRILAAADVYQACTQVRPHRPAMTPADAARTVEAEVAAGRLDREAAASVVQSAGQAFRHTRREWPGGLSDREVEVLRLLARGLSKKEIAKTLVIAPGTVHTHVTHIYSKLGVSTRAAVALFAVEHDLLGSSG
jgi:DNA-binding NarL/FixJ family response regulator